MDFIVDGLGNGRMVRILSVVDAYTRECLALEADTSLGSRRVTRVLEQIIEEHGRPESVRSDNGPEFCFAAHAGLGRGTEDRAGAYPAGQTDAERARGELPRQAARRVPERALVPHAERCTGYTGRLAREYNCERPHSSLGYRTPGEFRRATTGYADVETASRFPTSTQPRRRRDDLGAKPQPRISSYEWMRIRGHVVASTLTGAEVLWQHRDGKTDWLSMTQSDGIRAIAIPAVFLQHIFFIGLLCGGRRPLLHPLPVIMIPGILIEHEERTLKDPSAIITDDARETHSLPFVDSLP